VATAGVAFPNALMVTITELHSWIISRVADQLVKFKNLSFLNLAYWMNASTHTWKKCNLLITPFTLPQTVITYCRHER